MNSQPKNPLLTVIVPVYNEEGTLQEILTRIASAEPQNKEMIIVDDCSTDQSRKILKSWENVPNVVILFHEKNQGKSAAIRTALVHAAVKYTIIQDADMEYDPSDYMRLLEPMIDGTADVVYGSRSLARQHGNADRAFWNPFRICVAMLNWTVRILYHKKVTDEATCYKLFRTETLRTMQLQCRRFEFCPEVTAKTFRMGLRLIEIPIHYTPRKCNEGKKIGLRDAIEAFYTLWRWRNWNSELIETTPEQKVSERNSHHHKAFTLIELLVVISVIGTLAALLLPAVQAAREAARRTECINHLRQLGLAFTQHEGAFQRYPTGGWGYQWFTDGDRGTTKKQPGGWPFAVLPYIEQKPLYDMQHNKYGDEKQNALRILLTRPLELFYCPTRRSAELYLWQVHDLQSFPLNLDDYPDNACKTDYAVNGGSVDPKLGYIPLTLEQGDDALFPWQDISSGNGICYLRSEVKTGQITDGMSNTYLFGEKWVRTDALRDLGDDTAMYCGYDKDNTRWTNLPPVADNDEEHWDQFGSAHPGIVLFTMCDGSTRSIAIEIDPEIHQCLGARNGGNVVVPD